MSRITCERCTGEEFICLKCSKGWGWDNLVHTGRTWSGHKAIRRRDRIPCGEKHVATFFRCDGCQQETPPTTREPSGWASEWSVDHQLHLCVTCRERKAVAIDAAFDGALLKPRDPTAALIRDLNALDVGKPLSPNLIAVMRRVLARDQKSEAA